MQILDAFQQTLVAVMKKTGDAKDVEDDAEKLLEAMKGNSAALTEIMLASPVLQNVEQAVEWGSIRCNVCHIDFHSNVQLAAHKEGIKHKKGVRALALGLALDA